MSFRAYAAYAGIGSRETPKDICLIMKDMAGFLCSVRYVLRSGGADGADIVFESGVTDPTLKEIYLPWKNFNKNKSLLYEVSNKALAVAQEFHPAWGNLTTGARALIARNSYQVLGKFLDSPVDFIICWTPGGKLKGGTAQALRIAKKYNIPVFNLGRQKDLEFIKECYQTKQIPVRI